MQNIMQQELCGAALVSATVSITSEVQDQAGGVIVLPCTVRGVDVLCPGSL